MIKRILFASSIIASSALIAQKNFWKPAQSVGIASKSGLKDRKTQPSFYKIYNLDLSGLKSELSKAPQRGTENESLMLKFPDASGKYTDYVIQEAPTMSKELSEKYSDIKSYVGYEKGNSANSIRFSVSPYDGVNVMYFNNWDVSYMDTYSNDLSNYIVYKRADLPADPNRFNCDYKNHNFLYPEASENPILKPEIVKDGKLCTYRLALSTTVEYSNYHIGRAGVSGGTVDQKKAAVLAAMNTTMTRVNGVYEKTISSTLKMIDNNDLLISIDKDAYAPGFTNTDGEALLDENQDFVDKTVGNSAYDIGHIFSTGGGGIAATPSVCINSIKAQGVTGSPAPRGDAYDIDYVAHEMGHQFGGNHTFRADTGSCQDNANSATAVEPGSGSTIMAYAGICTKLNNIQANSDPYFHSVSINEMYNTITKSSDCSVKAPNNNTVPTADAGPDYTIPKGTAFVLTGKGTDPDGDAITYLWEQTDVAVLSNNPQPPTSTTKLGTVFRSYLPTTSTQRYFPRMEDIAANNLAPTWEVVPTVNRTLNFSLLVNDNRATGNQTARDFTRITVSTAGPFKVNSQTDASTYIGGSQMTVTWDVAGTDVAPINTSNVQILMSSDNGLTYPTIIAESVPNNGSAVVTLPNVDNPNARIMVKAVNNIYFAVNSAKFTINKNLAVNEADNIKSFAIYPNPAKGEVIIALSHTSKNASYHIVDLSGNLLSKGNLIGEKNLINIANLKTGTYRIVINDNGSVTSKNLIVK